MSGVHSLWSPSGAKRWRTCLGSVVMNDGTPDTASIYSAEGTAYHELVEWAVSNARRCADRIGCTLQADGFTFKVTEELADYAQEYVDALQARAAAGCIVRVEVKQDTSEVLGIPNQTGTVDGQVFDVPAETVEIHDFKFGAGVKVYVQDQNGDPNDQTLIYGAATMFAWLLLCNWKWLKLVIHQPRMGPPQELILSRADVEKYVEALRADAYKSYQVWQRFNKDASGLETHLTPTAEACRWCYRAGSCRARATKIRSMFPTAEQLKYMAEIPLTAKNLPTMSGPELAACLDRLDEIEQWARAVRAEALSRAETGSPDAAPGWKIVEGRKGDRTMDEVAALGRISNVISQMEPGKAIPKELYTEPQLKSVAQLEKATKKLGTIGKAIWRAICGDPEKGVPSLITQAPGRPTLVRDFDARPELAPQPVSFELRPIGQEFTSAGAAEGLL